jgi:hypothetical protein
MTSPGKPSNPVDTDGLDLIVPAGLKAQLRRLTSTHLFGKNANETAVQILAAEVRRLIVSGEMQKFLDQAPLEPDKKP